MVSKPATLKSAWDGDPLMYPAFIGFVSFALGSDDMLAQYRAETGDTWKIGATSFDRLIDHATGADFAFLQRFVTWCEDGPFGKPDDFARNYRPSGDVRAAG